MSNPIQWSYDVQGVIDLQEAIAELLSPNPGNRISATMLTDIRDKLDLLCREFGAAGMDQDAADAYVNLLDALAFLNMTLRLPFVERRHVRMAADRLERFFDWEVIS